MASKFDAIIIGAGQAGPSLAVKLGQSGQRVALIERSLVGGSCVNFGCTPTKAMIASARAAWTVRHAADYGIKVHGKVEIDMAAVIARTAAVVERSRSALRAWLESLDRATLIDGHARFDGARRIEVDGKSFSAGRVFINTGTRAAVPAIPGLDRIEFLTAAQMSSLNHVPDHLIVLGGGSIGVEFAQMFRRLGSQVTLIERHARLLDGEDSDVSDAVQQLLEAEGIDVLVDTQAKEIEPSSHGVRVTLDHSDGQQVIEGTDLLLALGRRPNTDDLGLETTSIEHDDKGYIRVDKQLHTSIAGIWALGDVNGVGAFTHTAYDDHAIVADELFGDGTRTLDHRINAYAVYTDPPFARVGSAEADLRGSGHAALIAKMPMSEVARAQERGETRGFMKVLVDAQTERLLGAAIVGIGGDEVVHGLLDLMYADAPYQVLRDSMGIHPTVSELLPTLLGRLQPLQPRAENAAPAASA